MIVAILPGAPVRAADPLRVCLEENTPPYSVHNEKDETKSHGFDLAVAEAIAKRLNRPLEIQWFETELDVDTSTTLQADALLSDGRCQLLGGYPLVVAALGKPQAENARLPDFDGAKAADRRRRVQLGTLIPSKAYHYAALTVVLGGPAASKQISSLADLEGIKLGDEEGTLADAILMIFGGRRFVNQITHVVPGPRSQLFDRLERGEFDATLVAAQRFDAYRAAHPDTKLKPSGFYHKIGFNMGMIALSTEQPLLDAVNGAIADMLAKGEMPALAQAAGMTYLPPHQPDVTENVTFVDIFRE
jgi:ABC-type amino acid transport substrate-binding protein